MPFAEMTACEKYLLRNLWLTSRYLPDQVSILDFAAKLFHYRLLFLITEFRYNYCFVTNNQNRFFPFTAKLSQFACSKLPEIAETTLDVRLTAMRSTYRAKPGSTIPLLSIKICFVVYNRTGIWYNKEKTFRRHKA